MTCMGPINACIGMAILVCLTAAPAVAGGKSENDALRAVIAAEHAPIATYEVPQPVDPRNVRDEVLNERFLELEERVERLERAINNTKKNQRQ